MDDEVAMEDCMNEMGEEEEEEEVERSFTVYEVDLDYEFDAARFFDFTRAESLAECRQAENWFDSAGSYPPSPFVVKLVGREEKFLGNINTSPKPKNVEDMNLSESDSDIEAECPVDMHYSGDGGKDHGVSTNLLISSIHKLQNPSKQLPSGLTFYNHMANNNSKPKAKLSVKPWLPRTSTLMKPTASQLAKQTQPLKAGDSRSNKSLVDKTPSGMESQAAKRQKLEGGHLRKVVGAVQQSSFVHKAPKRDTVVDGNTTLAKMKITIPREPDLETAQRAQRIRPKTSKEIEKMATNFRRFKALPLNRKILEAPSLLLPKRSTPRLPEFQEFHLKTSERALQHSSAVSTSAIPCSNSEKVLCNASTSTMECGYHESRRLNILDATKPEENESAYRFRALPLDKKILSSRGDIGIFRNNKKEITVPKEFNFQTEKRVHHNPPIELFNKLSLRSEVQTLSGPQSKSHKPTAIPSKGSKENRWGYFQQKHEMKESLPCSGGKQIHCSVNQETADGVGPVSAIARIMGIR